MKKLFIISVIIAIFSFYAEAQIYSKVRPTLIVWQVDNYKISLKKGLYGIPKPEALQLKLFFSPKQAQKYAKQGAVLQFRWYYYLSTRRKLVKVENKALNVAKKNPNGSITVSSTLKAVQPGWWEVQIISSIDRRHVQFAGVDRFQILIQPRSYTMR